eukprot:jgi/Mesvir1/12225/Mv00451-RA.1
MLQSTFSGLRLDAGCMLVNQVSRQKLATVASSSEKLPSAHSKATATTKNVLVEPTPPLARGVERKARVVCTDVDGTLLNSKHTLSPTVESALRACFAANVPVVLATGKARGPWVEPLRRQLGLTQPGWTLNGPAVFLQGLKVCDASGQLVHSRVMDRGLIEAVTDFAAEAGVTLTAYTEDDRIVARETDAQTDRLIPYAEPVPEALGAGFEKLGLPGHPAVHKMILMGEESRVVELRPALEALVGGQATLTRALPGMLEVLPMGESKGKGVQLALSMLGVGPGDALAMGDGENDLEMLALVRAAGGWAVAVENAGPRLKAAAQHFVGSNDEHGAAEAIQKFVL